MPTLESNERQFECSWNLCFPGSSFQLCSKKISLCLVILTHTGCGLFPRTPWKLTSSNGTHNITEQIRNNSKNRTCETNSKSQTLSTGKECQFSWERYQILVFRSLQTQAGIFSREAIVRQQGYQLPCGFLEGKQMEQQTRNIYVKCPNQGASFCPSDSRNMSQHISACHLVAIGKLQSSW